MDNLNSRGHIIDFVAGANITSGSLVKIGERVGVAVTDIASGATGAVRVEGVVEVPKLTTDVVTQGAPLYLDATNLRLTLTTDGPGSDVNILAGYAFAAAGNGETTVLVKLNG